MVNKGGGSHGKKSAVEEVWKYKFLDGTISYTSKMSAERLACEEMRHGLAVVKEPFLTISTTIQRHKPCRNSFSARAAEQKE